MNSSYMSIQTSTIFKYLKTKMTLGLNIFTMNFLKVSLSWCFGCKFSGAHQTSPTIGISIPAQEGIQCQTLKLNLMLEWYIDRLKGNRHYKINTWFMLFLQLIKSKEQLTVPRVKKILKWLNHMLWEYASVKVVTAEILK